MINPDVHDDDRPVGRVLSRREVLGLFGGAGALVLGGCTLEQFLAGTPAITSIPAASATDDVSSLTCIARPELTEGPYFVDTELNRSDIRSDSITGEVKEGVLLNLIFRVSDVSADACTPLSGAQVDVWHCDALGRYSDVTDRSFDTSGQQWLRGYQRTDATGTAEFTTIYPGWYSGRAVHIHFKIRTEPDAAQGYEFTSQFFFDENMTDVVHAQQPYASKGVRDVTNAEDGIFQNSDGLLTLEVVEDGDGYAATFGIGLDTTQSI